MKKVLTVCGYIGSALLFVSYFVILGTSRYPHVCREYELYYIEETLQDWPGYGGLEYRLGTPVVFIVKDANRPYRRGTSWNALEKDGCWTYGGYSSVYFTGMGEEDLSVAIDVQDVREGAETKVCVNGEAIGEIRSAGMYEWDVPGEILEEDMLLLEFLTSGFGPVGEDARNQGIKVREIVIDVARER